MERLAQLQEHVVRGVHHVVDRPGPGRPQAGGQPRRRRTHLDAPDHGAQVPEAEVRLLDPDRGSAGRGLPGILGQAQLNLRSVRKIGQPQAGVPVGGQLPGDPQVAQEITPVRRHLHVEAHVVQPERLDERRAGLDPAVELQETRVVPAQAELPLRAEHARRPGATDLGLPDRGSARQGGAHRREGVEPALPDVGGAAHDLDGFPARCHVTENEAVRAGVLPDPLHAGDPDLPQGPAQVHPLLHGRSPGGQPGGRFVGSEVDPRCHVPEPSVRDLHANCSRKRTSFSKKVRMSGIP